MWWETGVGLGQSADAPRRACQVVLGIFNLLLDILRLEHLVEILHTHIAATADIVRGIIGPVLRVDAPTGATPFASEPFLQSEAANQHNFSPGFAQSRDPRRGKPVIDITCIMVPQNAAQLSIVCIPGALALDGHDHCFAGVAVEESEDLIEEATQIFRTCQGDGKHAVHEHEPVIVQIFRIFWLNPKIKKSNAVFKLFGGRGRLTSDGREGTMARGRIVCTRN